MFGEQHLQLFWHKHASVLTDLKTTHNQSIEIVHPGSLNHHQGPDFLFAHIKVDQVEWVGNIEVHIKTTDWLKHFHDKDVNYRNIILHVVWINDADVYQSSPVVELSKFVSVDLLNIGDNEQKSIELSCSSFPITRVKVGLQQELYQLSMESLLQRKSNVLALFHDNHFDFSSVLWQLIFRAFGRSVNADCFEQVFKSIPIHLLRLYGYDQRLLECLLMGQSNLLESYFVDSYPKYLYNHYHILKLRHGLEPIHQQIHYLRLRPRNFPTIRLSQLAAFFHQNMALLNSVLRIEDLKELLQLFDVEHLPYWSNHFLFDRLSLMQYKEIGLEMRQQVIANAIVPFLLAYGEKHQDFKISDKAMRWYAELKPEKDTIVRAFTALGFQAENRQETQALHGVYKSLCLEKRCYDCVRGKMIGLV